MTLFNINVKSSSALNTAFDLTVFGSATKVKANYRSALNLSTCVVWLKHNFCFSSSDIIDIYQGSVARHLADSLLLCLPISHLCILHERDRFALAKCG